jgi:hypothetical protein
MPRRLTRRIQSTAIWIMTGWSRTERSALLQIAREQVGIGYADTLHDIGDEPSA